MKLRVHGDIDDRAGLSFCCAYCSRPLARLGRLSSLQGLPSQTACICLSWRKRQWWHNNPVERRHRFCSRTPCCPCRHDLTVSVTNQAQLKHTTIIYTLQCRLDDKVGRVAILFPLKASFMQVQLEMQKRGGHWRAEERAASQGIGPDTVGPVTRELDCIAGGCASDARQRSCHNEVR